MSALCSRILAEVQRVLLEHVRRLPAPAPGAPARVLLDVGCWDGAATCRYADALGARSLGIEVFAAPAREAEARGVEVARIDLETGVFPWPAESVDVVVCNQVFEHLKNPWLPMAEIHRVLRPGGHALLSVPNLGSLHNRVLLACGRQPTSIRVFGPHVRGFTRPEFEDFVGRGGAFAIVRSTAIGFHPLPPAWARVPNALWPGAGHTLLVVARRADGAPPWRAHLEAGQADGVQTYFAARQAE